MKNIVSGSAPRSRASIRLVRGVRAGIMSLGLGKWVHDFGYCCLIWGDCDHGLGRSGRRILCAMLVMADYLKSPFTNRFVANCAALSAERHSTRSPPGLLRCSATTP